MVVIREEIILETSLTRNGKNFKLHPFRGWGYHELVIFTQNFFMASKRLIVLLFLLVILKAYADDTLTLFSPNHNIRLTVSRQANGAT